MNKLALIKTAEFLEHGYPSFKFDLGYFCYPDPSVPGFFVDYEEYTGWSYPFFTNIGGYALARNAGYIPTNLASFREKVKYYLGLTESEYYDLMDPTCRFSILRDWEKIKKITAREAAGVVRHFVDTGYIDWNILARGR